MDIRLALEKSPGFPGFALFKKGPNISFFLNGLGIAPAAQEYACNYQYNKNTNFGVLHINSIGMIKYEIYRAGVQFSGGNPPIECFFYLIVDVCKKEIYDIYHGDKVTIAFSM